jgi:hypothetical protein
LKALDNGGFKGGGIGVVEIKAGCHSMSKLRLGIAWGR